jgi:uncharacterized NAD(P)/FAD-binding protein YdhS
MNRHSLQNLNASRILKLQSEVVRDMSAKTDIAIVGGGCSGTLVATQLFRHGFRGRLAVVESRSELGRGLAYSTQFSEHLLNVPAGKMSALPDQPSHFLDWLRLHGFPAAAPGTFAPRKKYGDYLEDLLHCEVRRSSHGVSAQHICAEALTVRTDSKSAQVVLGDGTRIETQRVVLAIGNPASSPAVNITMTGVEEWMNESPWHNGALSLRFPTEKILLLGTGLSAVDALLALLSQGGDARIYMISRRGLLPQSHAVCLPAPEFPALHGPQSARLLLRKLRARVETMTTLGQCWRPAVDSFRPVANEIWQDLSVADQRRFLRHLKSYWEPHRHRMAPQIAQQTERYRSDGRLRVIAGRIRKISRQGDSIEVRISSDGALDRVLEIDRVINCTGIYDNFCDSRRPLVRSMIADGAATANDLGLGFRTATNGALVDSDGKTSRTLFTLGPPRRGELFETTAVPEIRTQAEMLARHLIDS